MPKAYCPSSTGAPFCCGMGSWLGRLKLRAMAEKPKCVLGRYDRAAVSDVSESRYESFE